MQDFSASPREMVASFWRNRSLIYALSKREVAGRYRGSYFGMFWPFINPFLMLAIYTFVFSEIFQIRWNAAEGSKLQFAFILFLGLLVFNLFSECINLAPGLVIANVNYVKKVVFPLEILPYIGLTSALIHGLIGVAIWICGYTVFFGLPHLTFIYFPLVLFPLVLLILGLSWLLASVGVYLRDLNQIIGPAVSLMMFLSPVFYPANSLPEVYRSWLYLNPLTSVIEQMREVLFWGKEPSFIALGKSILITGLIAWLGFAWFQKTRKGFADVL